MIAKAAQRNETSIVISGLVSQDLEQSAELLALPVTAAPVTQSRWRHQKLAGVSHDVSLAALEGNNNNLKNKKQKITEVGLTTAERAARVGQSQLKRVEKRRKHNNAGLCQSNLVYPFSAQPSLEQEQKNVEDSWLPH